MSFKVATKNIYEIFDEYQQRTKKEDRIAVLRYNESYALKSVLKGMFDPNVEFVVERVPNYKPSDAPPGLSYTSMNQELGRAYLFEKNNPRVEPTLSYDRKEQILIQILEALEKREAEVYLMMLLKKPKIKGLDYKIVKEAFPDLLPWDNYDWLTYIMCSPFLRNTYVTKEKEEAV